MSERYKNVVLNFDATVKVKKNVLGEVDAKVETTKSYVPDMADIIRSVCISAGIIGDVEFETERGKEEELVINVVRNDIGNKYSDNYENPPIPDGYEYVRGSWYDGYVIQRKSDMSRFVWVPVGSLEANGTIDDINFTDKFGRRMQGCTGYVGLAGFYEGTNMQEQLESVKKYGGFYISCYRMSHRAENQIQSIKTKKPITDITVDDAVKLAMAFENTDKVKSHLTYGMEYDSIQEWIFETCDPSKIIKETLKEDSKEVMYINNMCFNCDRSENEWTQEKYYGVFNCVIRGGLFRFNNTTSAARILKPGDSKLQGTGFRVALYIE